MESQALRFLQSRHPSWAENPTLDVRPIVGGLESQVARVEVNAGGLGAGETGQPPLRWIMKRLRGVHRRERAVYRALWRGGSSPPAARVLASSSERGTCYLFLEDVPTLNTWPWCDVEMLAAVCRTLARLHQSRWEQIDVFHGWNYDVDLRRSAEETVVMAGLSRDERGARCWGRWGDLSTVVTALPEVREELRRGGQTVIHGDMHPGNVRVPTSEGSLRVVLIDWARARWGSPWEDVASWLHSAGCWEPEARRRHDTLLRTYLEARGLPPVLPPGLRRLYTLASACNGLAGAIRYHLTVLSNGDSSDSARRDSRQALDAWQRVIRQAALLLRRGRDALVVTRLEDAGDRRNGSVHPDHPASESP